MNLFSRIIISVILTGIYFCIPHFSYAASGKSLTWTPLSGGESRISTNSGGEVSDKDKKTSSWSLKQDENTTEEAETDGDEEEKIKQDINTYIIESYKAQGTKIIKDLSAKLTKTIPDADERIDAYKKIQNSLELRKKRLETDKMTTTKRLILREFLDHMIDLLGKKIEELT